MSVKSAKRQRTVVAEHEQIEGKPSEGSHGAVDDAISPYENNGKKTRLAENMRTCEASIVLVH